VPRPKTKAELQNASRHAYAQLDSISRGLTQAQRKATFPLKHRDKNVRDVFAHLYEWQLMMLTWYKIGMAGSKPDMPAKGFTWKTTPELNAVIWGKHQKTSMKQAQKKLTTSHEALQQIIASHTNDELFTKRRYPWTGTTSLGSYLVSATSSHYDWALKILRRYVRALNQE